MTYLVRCLDIYLLSLSLTHIKKLSSVFSGIISFGIGHTHTSLHPWRIMFLVLGGSSVLWSIFLFIFMPDSPVKCWYMSDREKYICLERVKDNNTGVEDKKIKLYQIRECLLDPKAWLLTAFSLAQNIPNGGLITFSSIIVRGLGYSNLITTLLGIPTGVVATLWQLLISYIATRFTGRYRNARCAVIAVSNLVTLACAILMWKLPRDNKHGLLAAYYVFYTYWGPFVISTSLPMANSSGHTKKLTLNSMYYLAYCVGNIVGPQLFRSSDAPIYSHGYEGLLACLVIAIATIAAYGLVCHLENRSRDREQHLEASQGVVDSVIDPVNAFSDLTDKEKRDFRYTF